jgi:serine/threonine protein kinase
MTTIASDDWPKISPYLDEALSIAEEQRDAWLSEIRNKSPELADRLRARLEEHAQLAHEHFLDVSPAPVSAVVGCPGQAVGAYVLVSLAGTGGMGRVWMAKRNDGRFDRSVAIKFLNFLVGGSAEERFRKEGSILGRLRHPHIAELIDAGVSPSGQPYLVLEFIDGEHIDSYSDRMQFSTEARIRLFLDVLDAVSHAHANLVVHRDIKPSNVMVSKQGCVKLLDFGIAKLLEEGSLEATGGTQAGSAMTPLFAAPEQIKGEPVTTRTDVYSLGVLLYLLLTGRHPAGPGPYSTADLVRAIVEIDPPRPSLAVLQSISDREGATKRDPSDTTRRAQSLRGDLDIVIAKAIKKNPADRYETVSALAADLRSYLEHKPVSARPDTLRYRAAKFVRRNRLAVAVVMLACVATIGGVTGIVIQGRRAQTERDFAIHQLARVQRHDELLEFLLSNAAPSGKPFTVNELLQRAERILNRQRTGNQEQRVELLDWIGGDYSAQDQPTLARPLLENAYQLSRNLADPAIRAEASCAFGAVLARDEDLTRAESLVQEGLRELPNDARFAISRVGCLRKGSEVSRQKGDSSEAVRRMEHAQRALRESPFDSDELEMGIWLDLASMLSEAGRDQEAIADFNRAAAIMSSLGRDETQTGIVLFNNLGLELDQVGRPLEAEAIYRHVIDISRDNSNEDAVSQMVLNNYARIQRELNHLVEAADYAERANSKAERAGDKLVINQSLLERSRIYLAQHDPSRSEAMLRQVEPKLRQVLPPGHYAFASVASGRAMIALERRDAATAKRLIDESISIVEAAIRSGGEGAFLLPRLLIMRSDIECAAGQPENAEADARRALGQLQPDMQAGSFSSRVGYAQLSLARALASQHKQEQSHQAARVAQEQLRSTIGADHSDTHLAEQLAAQL